MTVEELSRSLLNGFHDAELHSISVDDDRAEARMEVDVWIGELEPADRREVYRRAVVVQSDVLFLAMDVPSTRFSQGSLRIDDGPGQPSTSPITVPAEAEPVLHWFFVSQWNAFIRVAARRARMEWTGPEVSSA